MLLLREEVDPDVRDNRGRMPLHMGDSSEVAKMLLLRVDVDANARDNRGRMSPHYAAFGESSEVAKITLSREDVDANARDHEKETTLQAALVLTVLKSQSCFCRNMVLKSMFLTNITDATTLPGCGVRWCRRRGVGNKHHIILSDDLFLHTAPTLNIREQVSRGHFV